MMMILEVQEGADIALMPDELKDIIASVKGEFAEGIMIGTQPLLGMQLLFINVDASKDDVEALTNSDVFDDNGKQVAFDLGWSVLAVEDEIVDQSLLLPYFIDLPVFEFDEDGEYIQTGTEPVTDLTDKLQVWSGKKWLYK
tara:strand:- start:198 stop:620 length:423 start_codon:yes stop_codon:yes gene_type:complete